MAKTLLDVTPYEFEQQFYDTRAYTMRDCEVVEEVDGTVKRWPGPEKFVFNWWRLADGRCVGWNENPGRGWSFPVYGRKQKAK